MKKETKDVITWSFIEISKILLIVGFLTSLILIVIHGDAGM